MGLVFIKFGNFFFFFIFSFYFNWRLITLQYCGGFAIHSHESAMGVHVNVWQNHHNIVK